MADMFSATEETTAAARLHAAHDVMCQRLRDEQGPHLHDEERFALASLAEDRANSLKTAIEQLDPADDHAALALERQWLRPWLLDADDFTRRSHLAIAEPIWRSSPPDRNANGITFAGSSVVEAIVASACAERGLEITPSTADDPAHARWEAVRHAAICVVDLTEFRPDLPRWDRIDLGQAAYEIGLALTLGRPIVVLTAIDALLPFDLGLTPTQIDPSDETAARKLIGLAIDNAYSVSQRRSEASSIDATIDQALTHWVDPSDPTSPELAELARQRSTSGAGVDPVAVEDALTDLLASLGAAGPTLLKPAWPARYPTGRNCCHITSFEPAWGPRVRQLITENCVQQAQSLDSFRGGTGDASHVVASLWDEVGSATHLVVDITDPDLNALIALGIAHALGRKVLLISQQLSTNTDAPSIAHLPRIRYAMDTDGEAELWRALWLFLGDRVSKPEADAQPATADDSAIGVASFDDVARPEELACPRAQQVLAHILSVVEEPADEVEEGLLSYVMLVPSLLEGLYIGAHQVDELGKVEPLLDLLADYFLTVDDFIHDAHGVTGLIDDAYMALRCVEKLNEQAAAWGKPPLVEFDFGDLNTTVGAMMPDHITAQIETNLDTQILKASTKNWFNNNAGKVLLGAAAFTVAAAAVSGSSASGSGDDRLAAVLRSRAGEVGITY